ncbi:MAG: hypothetical protein NT175_09300 [Bacteroidetes bacterium]|nr:hypothetical protein [Bacteroidota bacterium]
MISILPGFLQRLMIFSLILGVIVYLICYFLPEQYVSRALPFLFPFFMAVTLIVFHFLIKTTEKKPGKFFSRIMLITVTKLLFFILVMVIYMLMHPTDKIPFMMAFFILYVCYTIFEVHSFIHYNNKTRY